MRQQAENSAERERLHLLIAKLESHTTQQSKSIDQEKWQLQQDTSRLKTQQTAFEEERASFLRKMEDDREQLQQAREKFLLEQREVLGKCYEERRRLATERAQLEVIKKRAKEREETDSQKSLQVRYYVNFLLCRFSFWEIWPKVQEAIQLVVVLYQAQYSVYMCMYIVHIHVHDCVLFFIALD